MVWVMVTESGVGVAVGVGVSVGCSVSVAPGIGSAVGVSVSAGSGVVADCVDDDRAVRVGPAVQAEIISRLSNRK
jgi:hypothetical protein